MPVAFRAALLAALVAAVPAVAADPAKPAAKAKSLQMAVFDKLLVKYQDSTYEQLHTALAADRKHVDKLSFDPTKAKYFDLIDKELKLTDAERQLYKKSGLVSIESSHRFTFAEAYRRIYTLDLPVLVTSDSILHAMHKSYDDVLKELEEYLFARAMRSALANAHDSLVGRAMKKVERSPDELAAMYDADLYLTVARNLFAGAACPAGEKSYNAKGEQVERWDGKTLPVPSVMGQDDLVVEILTKIRELKLLTPDTGPPFKIYGGERYIDFSQFKPRGHYTDSDGLRGYFRAMMWLGRVDCGWNVLPTDPKTGVTSDSDRELRAAALTVTLLHNTGGTKSLKAVDDMIGFLVGRSDNLTVFSLLKLMEQTKVSDFLAEAELAKLRDTIKTSGEAGQMIRSQVLISDPNDPFSKAPPPSVFQIFGQRFILDSFVLSQVVFDSIVYKNQKQERYAPTGLDVMAAFGNKDAIPLLEPELRKWNYSANLLAAKEFVDLHEPAFWKANLYNLWLDCFRSLNAEPAGANTFPETMRTKAWRTKQLQTQLGSWAELRHDTILYAKQSFTSGVLCEYPAGYVEPYPDFYAKVKFFATEAARLVDAADYEAFGTEATSGVVPKELKKNHSEFFKKFAATVGTLESLAQKELAGEAFTAEDKKFLKKTVEIGGGICGRPNYDGWYCDMFYKRRECDKWDPPIADIHTDPNTRTVLEVGVGDANFVVMAIDNGPDKMCFVGPVYSYYEFWHPADKRLTDTDWQQMLVKETAPKRPAWTSEFQAPARDKKFPFGNEHGGGKRGKAEQGRDRE